LLQMICLHSILSGISRCVFLCCFLSIFCFVGCDEQDAAAVAASKRIQSLVKVGSDIDAAIVALRKEKFDVGNKYKPTKKGDYYQVNVVLRNNIPVSETAKYVLDVPSKKRSYVVIKASLDGVIFSIE